MKTSLPSFLAMLFMANPIFAQSLFVQGTVTNLAGDPLPGATVVLKGTTTGTATLADGTYSLEVPDGQAVLIVSFLGYESQEVHVNGRTVVNIQFRESISELDEVVVVGFGNQRRRRLTSAVSSVDGEVFEKSPSSNFQRTLQGRMPGVVMTNSSGGLNAEAIIRIRGTGSISAGNQPIVVVDGLVLASRPGGVLGYSTNPYIGLNPNDIESVEVLKDAAAAAIYGSRGSNGVILITTKNGKYNAAPAVSLNYFAGFNEITRTRDLLTGPEYAQLWNDAATNAGITDPDVFYQNPAAEPSTDWQDLLLRKGFVQEVNASISGGMPGSRYYIGGTVRDEDFYLRTIGMQRYSVRANFEQKMNERWTAGFSVNPSQVIDKRTGNQWAGSAWGAASWYHPNVNAIDENGECRRDALITSNGQVGDFIGNPCSVLEDQWIEATRSQVLLNASLVWKPLKNLQFSTAWGGEFGQEKQELKFGSTTWFGHPDGWAWTYRQEVLNQNWTGLVTWQTTLGEGHQLDATAGVNLTKEQHDYLTVDGSGFADDQLLLVGSASFIEFAATSQSEAAFLGYLARANYSFKNRYLLTVSARYDGSSRFGTENRFGFFPAVSAGWIISDEDFFDLPAVDFLKFRSSIGLAGNASIADFASRGFVDFSPKYAGQPGFVIQSIENEELGWEKNLQWDAGFEFSMLKGRVSGSVEYFIKDTRDLLLEKPVPSTNGISILTSNIGSVRNQGLEFDLRLDVLKGEFNWQLHLNGATLKNEVRQLADLDNDGQDEEIIQYDRMLIRPGESIGTFFLVKYAGVDPANGDAFFFDLNNNKLANQAPASSRQIVGRSIPSFTGGFTSVFQFENFDLSAFFNFKTGHEIYMEDGNMEQNGTWGDNQHRSQLNVWTPSNRDTDVPEARLFQVNGSQESTRYLSPGDFLRLQHINLGYTFKIGGLSHRSVRLYAAVQNLATFTKFRGLDPDSEFRGPESAALGMIRFNLPATRTYSLGVSLNL